MKSLTFKVGIGIQSAAIHQYITYTGSQCFQKSYSKIQLVIILQKAVLDNVLDFLSVILIVFLCQLVCNDIDGIGKIVPHTIIGFSEVFQNGLVVFLPQFP
nr:hypothetical protein [Sedimentibacter sp.]